MQHSAHSGSGRRQDRVPLAVGVGLRGVDATLLDASGSQKLGSQKLEQAREALALEADGLNVSIGGIAMRAAFVPPLGAVLECSFECPPTGELVCAQGEVVWSERTGPSDGQFGLRFVELDTKSATALRRFVSPTSAHEVKPERARAATLVIDGLGTTVEAELKLADDSRIVLEQQLSFLQLGRGVEVSVPGRGKERGRIASVELRHSHFDVPTLVFGVLLDEAPERASVERFELAANELAPLFSSPAREPELEPELRFERVVGAQVAVGARMRESSERVPGWGRVSEPPSQRPSEPLIVRAMHEEPHDDIPDDDHELAASDDERRNELPGEPTKKAQVQLGGKLLIHHHQPQLPASAADSAPAMCVEDAEVSPDQSEEYTLRSADASAEPQAQHAAAELEDELLAVNPHDEAPLEDAELDQEGDAESSLEADTANTQAHQATEAGLPALSVRSLPVHLRALFRAPVARMQGLRQRIEPALREQAEYFDLPDAKSRLLLQLARLRMWLLQSWSQVRRSTARSGPRTPRTLRMQRSTLLGLGPSADNERPEPSRRARSVAVAFAVVGIGLGVYALAPRSGADRIKLPARVQGQPDALASTAENPAASEDELELADEPVEPEPAPKRKVRDPAGKRAAQAEAGKPVLSAPFGELEVPNGRVFTLRMNGPVQVVDGEARENGITVRVPGRQALDRASPIAASHSAVQRAMILNRGGFAELTIDFVPGTTPHYQVRGRDNTLEVTLERL